MNKSEWKKWVGVVGRILLTYALVFAQGAWAGQNQATKDKASSPQNAAVQQTSEKQPPVATSAKAPDEQAQGKESESAVAEEKPSGDASHQGIKVHGHWTIEVRNPDGTLVTHREFENSLSTLGGAAMSLLLARQVSAGGWLIYLGGSGAGPCISAGGSPSVCQIEEPSLATNLSAPFIFNTLAPPTVDANNRLVLSGQATAAMNDAINSVQTWLVRCANTIAPAASCQYIGNLQTSFTVATASSSNPSFSTPIPVQASQTIAVTVVISFS